jgi:hypothetical protein
MGDEKIDIDGVDCAQVRETAWLEPRMDAFRDGVMVLSDRAGTSAEFPGAAGRVHGTLVIGSGGHGVAVRAMPRQQACCRS